MFAPVPLRLLLVNASYLSSFGKVEQKVLSECNNNALSCVLSIDISCIVKCETKD